MRCLSITSGTATIDCRARKRPNLACRRGLEWSVIIVERTLTHTHSQSDHATGTAHLRRAARRRRCGGGRHWRTRRRHQLCLRKHATWCRCAHVHKCTACSRLCAASRRSGTITRTCSATRSRRSRPRRPAYSSLVCPRSAMRKYPLLPTCCAAWRRARARPTLS
jgi:hypothetical protein